LLKVKNLEIFGYDRVTKSDASLSFWSYDFMNLLYVIEASVLAVTIRIGADRDTLFTRGLWVNFLRMSCATPLFATGGYIFNKYLKHTVPVTFLRELYFYNYMGQVVTFQGSKIVSKDKLLGHDYFSQEYAKD